MTGIDLAAVRKAVAEEMDPGRFRHAVGTMQTARMLAEQYGLDGELAACAGLAHDVARNWPGEKIADYCDRLDQPDTVAAYRGWGSGLLHAPAGAAWLHRQHPGLADDVYRAIARHPTGCRDWCRLGWLLFIADYIEPTRVFAGVAAVRNAVARLPLPGAVAVIVERKMDYLHATDREVHPWSLAWQKALPKDRL